MALFKSQRSLSEIEEETERLEAENRRSGVELSVAQKRQAISELKKRGLQPSHFGWDWRKIWQWLKTH